MVTNFKSNRPFNNFLLLIYGLVLSWSIFAKPSKIASESETAILYTTFKKYILNISEHNKLAPTFCVLLLLFVQAILINQISIKQKLFPKINYLAGMCFLLFTSIFINKIELSAALTVSPILVWILSKLCGLQNATDPKKLLFNIGLIYGVASLIYQPSLIFLFVILFALLITRPFRLTEWVLLLLGGVTPYYFIVSWLFLSEKRIDHFIPSFKINVPTVDFIGWETFACVLILLILLYSMYSIHINMRKLLVQSRNSWTIIFFCFFISTFIPFFSISDNVSNWIYIACPLAIISAATFLYINQKWVIIGLHWVLVILSIFIGYFYMLK